MSEYFTSSDEELEELLQILEVPKTTNFFEEIVPQLTDHHYFEHFRVSREVSQRLSEQFEASEYFHHQEGDSEKAQIVCDHRRKIRDIFVGYPGSVHDSRIFNASPLGQTLPIKCGEQYIIGDSGYPCLKHLLTPFKDRGQLTRRHRNYNYMLSKNRYIIEHCFGILTQKFRQLYHLKLRSIPDCVHFIRACAVLHNLAIDDHFIIEEVAVDPDNVVVAPNEEAEEDDRDGVTKRNEVMARLHLQI
ncbi:hypothetical protein MML48_1g05754 [Holotrichia oblita]|uniref:Uncharacterized protein n=1 Tax=Holotrichia oblita TaxID=644536 RepID=A0ACB9TXT8_HOLOL|nr:hypothetical protein MML48_1g05754 [Holotrichia oblita]